MSEREHKARQELGLLRVGNVGGKGGGLVTITVSLESIADRLDASESVSAFDGSDVAVVGVDSGN
jgi:hypothetical protein